MLFNLLTEDTFSPQPIEGEKKKRKYFTTKIKSYSYSSDSMFT